MEAIYNEDEIYHALNRAENMTIEDFKSLECKIEDSRQFKQLLNDTLSIFTNNFIQTLEEGVDDEEW